MKIECEECGRVLEDAEKVIIYSKSSVWDDFEDHTFSAANYMPLSICGLLPNCLVPSIQIPAIHFGLKL